MTEITPDDIHLTKTIERDNGNLAWHFAHHAAERGLLLQGMYDTEIDETNVDVVDVEQMRQNVGSFVMRLSVPSHEVHDPSAVRVALAGQLPRVLERYDVHTDQDQLPLW